MSKVSKATKAFEIVRANQDKRPKEVISELETVLGMARRGASTYFYNAKRKLNVAAEQDKREARNARRRQLRAEKKAALEASVQSDVELDIATPFVETEEFEAA